MTVLAARMGGNEPMEARIEGAADMPAVRPSVVHLLADAARRAPDHEAVVCGEERLTYAELAVRVASLAAAIHAQIGDGPARVATLLANGIDVVLAIYAVQASGAQLVPLNPCYTAFELAPILEDAAPALVICGPDAREAVAGAGYGGAVWHTSHTRRLSQFATGEARLDDHLPDPASLAVLQYTGGTTGRSKGVDLRHDATAINVAQREALLPTEPERDRVLAISPLFHVYALHMCLYLAANARATLVVLPRYRPEIVFKTVMRERITLLSGSPTIFSGLMAHEDFAATDWSSLRLCFSGASALPEETLRRFEAATGCPICEGYGQSESGPVLAFNPAAGLRKPGSVGIAVPRTTIAIREGGRTLARGEIGEVCARGPQMMQGYRNLPDLSAETLRDGWLHTGDLGSIDEDGLLRIADRKKDMLLVSGFNVYPREIEEALFAHGGVRDAGVVGRADGYRGEVPIAFVVSDADEEALAAHCETCLAKYKRPALFVRLDALPKTSVGKTDKVALRALLADHGGQA